MIAMISFVLIALLREHVEQSLCVTLNEVTYASLDHIASALVELQPAVLHHVYRLFRMIVECEI